MTPRWRAKSLPELAPAPTTVEIWIATVCTAILPLLLIRNAFGANVFPGNPMGEGWGRIFAIEQVSRWWTGEAAPWNADLLGHPEIVSFWPVDPLITLPASLLSLGIGPIHTLTLVVFALLWLAGWGPWRLARRLGARRVPAIVGGVVVQTQPFLLRNAEDTLLEMLAIGLAALAIRALLDAWTSPGLQTWLRALGWTLLLGLASPYLTVYLATGWALLALAPAIHIKLKRYLKIASAIALGAFLAAVPILWLESGPHGRLSHEGGYGLHPDTLVIEVDGKPQEVRGAPRPAPLEALVSQAPSKGEMRPPSEWKRALVRFPGGLACAVGLLLGLLSKRGRNWAVLAATFFLLGPGPLLFARTLGLPDPSWMPLQVLLSTFPMGEALGNPQRMMLAFGLLSAISGAVGSTEHRLGVAIWAAVALFTIALTQPRVALSACALHDGVAPIDAPDGAVLTFPSGDPPLWNPGVPPKYGLAVASVHSQPVAYDYGRGRVRVDADFLYALSLTSQVAVGRNTNTPSDLDVGRNIRRLRNHGFRHVVLFDHLLRPDSANRAHQWLSEHLGEPVSQSRWSSVYTLPDPSH